MSFKGDLLKAGISTDGKNIDFFDLASLKVQGTKIIGVQGAAVSDVGAVESGTLTDNSGGEASQTLAAITGGGAGCENATKNAIASLADEVNKLITDVTDIRTQFNAVLAEMRTHGLIAT